MIYMIYLLGDSHILQIENSDIIKVATKARDKGKCFGCYEAGSAMGLNKKKSTLKYNEKILNDIKTLDLTNNKIALKFGQVDTEFAYYLKLIKNKDLKFEDFAKDSVNKYFEFIPCGKYFICQSS